MVVGWTPVADVGFSKAREMQKAGLVSEGFLVGPIESFSLRSLCNQRQDGKRYREL